MAASVRLFGVLRITNGGATSLRTVGAAVQMSHLASRASSASLQRQPTFPLIPPTTWQQSRLSSFFNKLTANELWKGVAADTTTGRKGRGKRSKPQVIRDLNRGQRIGEGRGGYLWPGLNIPILKDDVVQNMGKRSEALQLEAQTELYRRRDEWVSLRKMRKKKERGWSGGSWGGISIGPPDPGPNGETYEDFETRIIELKSVFTMTAKDGRKRTISCLAAVGNGKGSAGFALGKGPNKFSAMKKAKNRAIQYLYYIERYNDHTIFHDFDCKFHKTTLRIRKKNEGYGLRCHRAVITLCKLIGIKDMFCIKDGPSNLLSITRALFAGLASQETFQTLADRKQLHVVEYQPNRGLLPIVVASPRNGVRPNPEPVDKIPDIKLHWKEVQAKQGQKKSKWAGLKH